MVYTKTFTVLTSEYNQYMLITDQKNINLRVQ